MYRSVSFGTVKVTETCRYFGNVLKGRIDDWVLEFECSGVDVFSEGWDVDRFSDDMVTNVLNEVCDFAEYVKWNSFNFGLVCVEYVRGPEFLFVFMCYKIHRTAGLWPCNIEFISTKLPTGTYHNIMGDESVVWKIRNFFT